MTHDAELDPYTCDYTGQAITSLANAVYLRLMTPLGSWWADTSFGSRLHELQRCKDLAHVRRLAVQYSEVALAPLLADGRARAIRVTASHPGRAGASSFAKDASGAGRCLLHVEVEDNTGGRAIYQYPITLA